MTLTLFAHLLGAAVWVGGLIVLGAAAGVARATVSERERTAFFRVLGRRFLLIAGIGALLLLITGIDLVDDRFGGFGELGSADGGGLVIAKTAVFGGVIVLAIVHSLVLGPRMRRLRERVAGGDDQAEADLRRLAPIAGITQMAMLAGTITVLWLAADLVS